MLNPLSGRFSRSSVGQTFSSQDIDRGANTMQLRPPGVQNAPSGKRCGSDKRLPAVVSILALKPCDGCYPHRAEGQTCERKDAVSDFSPGGRFQVDQALMTTPRVLAPQAKVQAERRAKCVPRASTSLQLRGDIIWKASWELRAHSPRRSDPRQRGERSRTG